MSDYFDEIVGEWTLRTRPIGRGAGASSDLSYTEMLRHLRFFSEKHYSRYIPTLFPPHTPDFMERLRGWMTNDGLDEDQKRVMFEFSLRLAYFSFEDFLALYRSAFNEIVPRWMIDLLSLQMTDPDHLGKINEERFKNTWYCSITDSMLISEFYHVNGISGIEKRPPFQVLKAFSDPSQIKGYMEKMGLKRLVLLEDFVGSGTQAFGILKWCLKNLDCEVLFIPMLICSRGEFFIRKLQVKFPNFKIEPVLRLDDSVFIPKRNPSDLLLDKFSVLAGDVHEKIFGSPELRTGISRFGFQGMGGAVVLFSNTPNNTMPIIHESGRTPSTWKALFPRVSRRHA